MRRQPRHVRTGSINPCLADEAGPMKVSVSLVSGDIGTLYVSDQQRFKTSTHKLGSFLRWPTLHRLNKQDNVYHK